MMRPDIVAISLEQAGVVIPVVLGGLVQTAGAALGIPQILSAFLIRVGLGHVDQLAGLDGLQLDAEGVHQLAVQSAAETEVSRIAGW